MKAEHVIELFIAVMGLLLGVLFLVMVFLGMPTLVVQTYAAYDCWVQKDPSNFSCYYTRGNNHRIKLEDIPK